MNISDMYVVSLSCKISGTNKYTLIVLLHQKYLAKLLYLVFLFYKNSINKLIFCYVNDKIKRSKNGAKTVIVCLTIFLTKSQEILTHNKIETSLLLYN